MLSKINYFKPLAVFLSTAYFLVLPGMAFSSTGESMPWDVVLQKLITNFTGPLPVAIGIIAIVAGCFIFMKNGGEGAAKIFIPVIGIAIAVNAPNLVRTFVGVSSGFCF